MRVREQDEAPRRCCSCADRGTGEQSSRARWCVFVPAAGVQGSGIQQVMSPLAGVCVALNKWTRSESNIRGEKIRPATPRKNV